jgi:hypothetical protein
MIAKHERVEKGSMLSVILARLEGGGTDSDSFGSFNSFD